MKWEEPPPRTRGATGMAYREEAEALRNNPGQWARLVEAKSQSDAARLAHSFRTGRYKAFREDGAWETAARTVEGRFYVYARYMGSRAPSEGESG